MRSFFLSVLATACFMSVPARAQDWSFEITPYVWAPSVDSSLNIGPNPPVDGSSNLFDILKGAFLIRGHALRGPLRLTGEFNYLKLGDDFATTSIGTLGSWELEGVMASLAAGYAVYQSSGTRIELLGGLRGWDMDVSTRVLNRTASDGKSWIDPIVGASFETPLTDSLKLEGLANIGGFGVGSDFQWEVQGEVDWAVSDRIGLGLGYRYLEVDFGRSGTVIDFKFSGPYLALGFKF